MIKTNDIELNS